MRLCCKFTFAFTVNRRQNEWVDKTRLVIPKPVKEEAEVANGTSSDVAENGKTPQKRKNEEEDPEPKVTPAPNLSPVLATSMGWSVPRLLVSPVT